jgi:hypothetical protein
MTDLSRSTLANRYRFFFQDKAAMTFQGPWIEDQNIIASHEDPNNYIPIIAPSDQKPVRVSGFQEQLQF